MDARSSTNSNLAIDLQTLVDSHDRPFVVIDRDYRIIAINDAYRKTYCTSDGQVIGGECFRISHHNSVPCCELGQECPHSLVFKQSRAGICTHVHYGQDHRMRTVKVRAIPLHTADGELYLGELLEEVLIPQQLPTSTVNLVGESLPFLACMEQLKLVAASHPPVLLQGETGTGKELAARFIHDHSPRSDKPFLTVDCTTLTDTLFEAEVFGHTRGAYTGSVGEKAGLFELADGGTLFLDEIGDMPVTQQSKLLRILETGQFRRVGGRNTRKADVRIICASNRHLWDAVREGQFREDLYYRIACLTVRMPSLRERLDDVGVLSRTLLNNIGNTMQRQFRLAEDAVARLRTYDFPGNIRELRNILFVAVSQSSGQEIGAELIDLVINQLMRSRAQSTAYPGCKDAAPTMSPPVTKETPIASLRDNEARHISVLLERFGGNRARVAGSLGISERTLYRKLKKFGLS